MTVALRNGSMTTEPPEIITDQVLLWSAKISLHQIYYETPGPNTCSSRGHTPAENPPPPALNDKRALSYHHDCPLIRIRNLSWFGKKPIRSGRRLQDHKYVQCGMRSGKGLVSPVDIVEYCLACLESELLRGLKGNAANNPGFQWLSNHLDGWVSIERSTSRHIIR